MIPSDAAIDAVVAQTGMGRMQAIRLAAHAIAEAVLAPALDNLTADHARFRARLDAACGGFDR